MQNLTKIKSAFYTFDIIRPFSLALICNFQFLLSAEFCKILQKHAYKMLRIIKQAETKSLRNTKGLEENCSAVGKLCAGETLRMIYSLFLLYSFFE